MLEPKIRKPVFCRNSWVSAVSQTVFWKHENLHEEALLASSVALIRHIKPCCWASSFFDQQSWQQSCSVNLSWQLWGGGRPGVGDYVVLAAFVLSASSLGRGFWKRRCRRVRSVMFCSLWAEVVVLEYVWCAVGCFTPSPWTSADVRLGESETESSWTS